jgi:hypothetical protein
MRKISLMLLLSGALLNVSSTFKATDLYQVISSHPHDVEELAPFIKTIHQSGRLWVVKLKKNAPQDVLSHLKPLTGEEKSYVYQGTKLLKGLADKRIKTIVQKVDKNAIRKDVEDLSLNYKTRYAGTEENRKALKSVTARFTSMGYSVSETCYSADACSIIAEKTGLEIPHEVNLVMGHIDSVGKSFAGADDNASGTAVVLEMARVLKNVKNRRTLRFFITNGEELGLLGATHYAKELESDGKIKEIVLAINMDMVGYNSNNLVELETDPEHEQLAMKFADLASTYTKLKTKITLGAWGSDHVPFLKRGIPTILTIESWDTKTPCYHQACDKPDTLNYDYAAEIAKLNISAVMNKDQN